MSVEQNIMSRWRRLGSPLAAMTALQACVALAVFAVPVLAPHLGGGLSPALLGLYGVIVFGLGAVTSLFGGLLCNRIGPIRLAQAVLGCVMLAMLLLAAGQPIGFLLAAILLGLAFGPETPASSAVLAQAAQPQERSLVFSLRQTGNQIGAMAGSLLLPVLAAGDWRHGPWLVASAALLLAIACQPLGRRFAATQARTMRWQEGLALLQQNAGLGRLAAASLGYSAMQMSLNTFLISFLTLELSLDFVAAGILLAVAQGGGLIGRLSWGWMTRYLGGPAAVIAGLGLAMAICAILVGSVMPYLHGSGLFALVFLFGLTASGWNGVFLAEVARHAPPDQVAAATGAVLLASYSGLVLAPLLVGLLASGLGYGAAFIFLGLLCLVGTWPLRKLVWP